MNTFRSEITSFIEELAENHTHEPWGMVVPDKRLGFIFNTLEHEQLIEENLPKNNLKLIYIWEDHWLLKQHIVKARIRSLFNLTERVFARKTNVVKLHKPELMQFLVSHHLNKPANGKFKYGLMLDNELVAVAVFSASCPVHRGNEVYKSHQLIRFCNKSGITVVGGLSKLISYFIKKQLPEDIMTYADLDWSDGKSYLKIGFKRIGELLPQKFSVNKDLVRNYKEAIPSNNRMYTNQGSAKYLLDLKNAF